MAEPERIDVLQFMSLRQASTVDDVTLYRDFVRDDARLVPEGVMISSSALPDQSDFATMIVREVFCTSDITDKKLVMKVLGKTRKVTVPCDGTGPTGLDALDQFKYAHRFDDGTFRILPDRLETALPKADAELLTRLRRLMLKATVEPEPTAGTTAPTDEVFDFGDLVKSIEQLLQGTLLGFVFDHGELSRLFQQRKRVLFDALYKLYVLRRRIAVDLQEVMDGLATLHALEWIAIERFLRRVSNRLGSLDVDEKKLLESLETWLPELQPFGLVAGMPPELVDSRKALLRLLNAIPIVHPIFAQLHRWRQPFNPIRPIGIGDLKVVKQWLVEYLPGEISHVANVLKGETNERTTRTLEKTEDVFSFTGTTSQETSSDTQTTDHLELKREVESTVKTDLSLKVDASVSASYSAGWAVTIGASTGFAFSRSTEDASKVAQQFAHDVVSKAVDKLQSQSTQTRSRTKTFESEETVKHTLENKTGPHVNGFYRFVDKSYMAQLYNFGKRLMFEFIVPEPASFLVESRMLAFEGGTDVPARPTRPTLKMAELKFKPTDINKTKWEELRTTYDLSGLPPYPPQRKTVQLINRDTNSALFAELNPSPSATGNRWWAASFRVPVDGVGYEVSKVMVNGDVYFVGGVQNVAAGISDYDRWLVNIVLDGTRVIRDEVQADDTRKWKGYYSPSNDRLLNPRLPVSGTEMTLAIEVQNLHDFTFTFELELQLSSQGLADWQTQIFNAVRAKEQEFLDGENREALMQFQSDLGDYYRALKDLAGTAVNDLLQGQSSAANKRIIDLELRRHCLAELSKEFDADTSDDSVSRMETVGDFKVDVDFQKMKVSEDEQDDGTVSTTFSWEAERHEDVPYPATMLPQAHKKGNMVQFLEQAFDWDNLSYLFYPYFWATPPKWVDLMSRGDDADAVYTSFLQAGSARVLVSVTPGYEQAAMHYLATGQPWDGGVAPAIGDPLFVAVYQELREQQDNLANATAEGEPWTFVLPTSLTYLDGGDPLPTFPQDTPGG